MEQELSYDEYKLMAISFDNNVDETTMRLFQHIYSVLKIAPDLFMNYEKMKCHERVIEYILGYRSLEEFENEPFYEALHDIVIGAIEENKQLDKQLYEEAGLENRSTKEYKERLKFYKDDEYREKILNQFLNIVIYNFNNYDEERILKSLKRQDEKIKQQEKQFNEWMEL